MSSQHFALIARSERLVVTTSPDDDDDSANPPTNIGGFSPPLNNVNGTPNDKTRTELTALYQTYAELYPNPHLTEEARERDTLLKAASAAASANQEAYRPKKQSKKRGFFASLFGRGGGGSEKEEDKNGISTVTNDQDDSLIYTDIVNEVKEGEEQHNNNNDDLFLCGTTHSLETSCIPDEAYTVARFHLTSTRTRRGDQPNAVRRPASHLHPPGMSSDTRQPLSMENNLSLVVVGLGCIAEFPTPASTGGDTYRGDNPRVLTTSDREDLLTYATTTTTMTTATNSTTTTTTSSSRIFRLEQVRASSIGPNCLAVSWGFEDGLVVFYRRLELPCFPDDTPDDGEDYLVGWQAVWMLGPSQPVMENMADVFQQDEDDAPGSPLLRVSDMIPLIVTPPTNDDSNRPTSVATLALSRLGGYMELVPLPTPLWYGEEISLDDEHRGQMEEQLKNKRKGKRKRRQGQHYAVGSNIQVGTRDQTVAVTTLDYHIDIMCLEAFRTQVTGDTEWDTRAFPDSPPAEFVLTATGTSKQHKQETLTFWAVSTIFTDDAADSFHLHAVLIEALTASSGAGVSIFATPNIMKRWRKKRNVQLRDDGGLAPGVPLAASGENQIPNKSTDHRVTTISTSAPIVSMRFVNKTAGGPFLALLDWNGSATIMDCSVMAKLASQSMSPREYDLYRNASHHMPFPLATTIVTRTHLVNLLRRNRGTSNASMVRPSSSLVMNLHWLTPSLSSSSPSNKIRMLPPLVLLVGRPQQQLYIVSFEILDADERGDNDKGPKSYLTSLRFPARGAAMETLDEGQLSFVSVGHRNKRKRTNKDRSLSLFVMQRLQPLAIIQSLAKAGKHQEAIQAAQNLSEAEQQEISTLVRDCHKQLWQRNGDVDSLANTNNAQFILQEAVALCRQTSVSELPGGVRKLEKLRSICCLALEQSRNCQPENDEETAIDVVRSFLVKLGTYELLCGQFSVEPSYIRFREEFVELPVLDLAMQFARTADILALSTVFFRHSRDLLQNAISILDQIPLSIDPASYRHLLPIVRGDGTLSDVFLSSTNSDQPPLHRSHMPQYLDEMEGHAIVLDRKDEAMVLDFCKPTSNENNDENRTIDLASSVADWFSSRASKMQTFVGRLPPVILLCELGLRCTVTSSLDESSILEASESIQKLYQTWRSACSLHEMLAEGVVALDVGYDGGGVDSINTSDLLSMELVDIVALVLQGETDKDEILSRCTNYLQPLMMNIAFSAASDSDDTSVELDDAVASYCTGLVRGIAEINKKNEVELVGYAREALAACAAIAACSTTLQSKCNRLIKNKKVLCEMVLTSIHETAIALKDIVIPPTSIREIITSIWDLYEALPEHVPSTMPFAESWVPLLERIDFVFQDLVGVDLLSRWPDCRAFSFYCKMQNARDVANVENSERLVDVGVSAVEKMCQSFCSQVHYGMVLEDNFNFNRLLDLLSDLEQLHEVCYAATLRMGPLLCEHLVRPLLHQGLFHVVAAFLSNAPSNFVERDHVTRTVLAYVDEAVFSDGSEDTKILAAIKCQDVIGPTFPDLHAGFLSVRRYLDAANFINTVIYDGRGEENPSNLRQKLPLDVVESILADNPSSVACGCLQWTDDTYAFKANQMLREAVSGNSPESQLDASNLPSLPGGAIFHLATILGLEDDVSALVVKCRVSHYAMVEGWFGAAAAICRTLVCERKISSLGNDAEAHARLSAVAEVVSEERYPDILTKQELCTSALRKFRGALSFDNSSAFDVIVKAYARLDQRTSLFSRERQDLYMEPSHPTMQRPVARMYRDIQLEYKADVHALFSDLQSQTSQGLVHDSLMNALSRFVVYWSISDSARLKSLLDHSEKADAGDILALGCALILSTPSKDTAISCAQDLLNIATDQAANVSSEERFGTSLCRPDPKIVQYLVGHGYSENGARRATAVTQNSGVDAALAWAMTHSFDDDFNEPIVVLKIPNQKFIDEDAIQALQKSLLAIKGFLEEDGSIDGTLSSLATMRRTVTEEDALFPRDATTDEEHDIPPTSENCPSPKITSPSSSSKIVNSAASPPSHPSSEMRGIASSPTPTRVPPPPPPPPKTRAKPTDITNNVPHSPPEHMNRNLPSSINDVRPGRNSSAAPKPPAPPTPTPPIKPPPSLLPTKEVVSVGRAQRKPPGNGGLVAQPPQILDVHTGPPAVGIALRTVSAPSPPTKPLLSREQLRKRGEAALGKLRITTTKTVNIASDRKRLMEEGRKLLRLAKSKSPAAAAVVAGPPRPFEQQHHQSPRPAPSSTPNASPKRGLVPRNSLEVETHTHEIPLRQDQHQLSSAPDLSDSASSSSSTVQSTFEDDAVDGINGSNNDINGDDGDTASQGSGWDFDW